MRFGSVCSGIEAASVALSPLGWRAQFVSEIEAFPSAVLKHHYPTVPNLGDMTNFKDWPDASLDVLCGGTPCQSYSNAGLRAGLDDPRGQLMLTFGAIAARYRPEWLVWENVPGVLSSNGGRDFGAFLGLLGFLGYGFAYRVLDAQFVRVDGHGRAVPQRRNRVFVVGCLGDWRRAAAVLLERESLRGDPAPRRRSAEDVAPTVTGGARKRGGYSTDDLQPIAATLDASYGRLQGASGQDANHGHSHLVAYGGNRTSGARDVASALSAHGGTGRHDFESETFIAHAFDARQTDVLQYGQIAGPLDTDAFSQAIAFQERGREDGRSLEIGGDTAYALTAPKDGGRAQERNLLDPQMRVRRLMPVECARLMGFPDNYLDITFRGKPASDGVKYKALGNSWATNCARWIGRRIDLVEGIPTRAAPIDIMYREPEKMTP